MAKNGKVAYTGYAALVPNDGSANSHTSMSRTAYNDNNCKVSNRYTETYKSGDYVTRAGDVGYKQEARATSTVRVTDKVQGITTEYQTQVNVKETVYPTPAKSSSNNRINYY
ncbi:uncharacterized protein LOC129308055 [Prosopis cineraria]|uniref:uncharacterized protein LOC129308055 n=1 Tax=Prosopis cineraria TaxID=364024 RepID=UPI00240FC4E6|nr:uncharacterized protein LOC129308055 [Prosopis cineraria]XP_054805010.1 uncharacterized protein LOC129308055 [Prosopis cineraria]